MWYVLCQPRLARRRALAGRPGVGLDCCSGPSALHGRVGVAHSTLSLTCSTSTRLTRYGFTTVHGSWTLIGRWDAGTLLSILLCVGTPFLSVLTVRLRLPGRHGRGARAERGRPEGESTAEKPYFMRECATHVSRAWRWRGFRLLVLPLGFLNSKIDAYRRMWYVDLDVRLSARLKTAAGRAGAGGGERIRAPAAGRRRPRRLRLVQYVVTSTTSWAPLKTLSNQVIEPKIR